MIMFTLRLICKLAILIPITLPVLFGTAILSMAIGDHEFKHWLEFNEGMISAIPFSEHWKIINRK